jgi:hypothetical protein
MYFAIFLDIKANIYLLKLVYRDVNHNAISFDAKASRKKYKPNLLVA